LLRRADFCGTAALQTGPGLRRALAGLRLRPPCGQVQEAGPAPGSPGDGLVGAVSKDEDRPPVQRVKIDPSFASPAFQLPKAERAPIGNGGAKEGRACKDRISAWFAGC